MQRKIIGFADKPFDVFVLRVGGDVFVGIKTPAVPRPGVAPRKCAIVGPEMLIGELVEARINERGINIYHRPLEPSRAREVFVHARDDDRSDLSYPFVRLTRETFMERAPTVEDWNVDAQEAQNLDDDEFFIRGAARQALAPHAAAIRTVYDPACSTGTFLHELKDSFPHLCVMGQDCNETMIELARPKLDQVWLGNSAKPGPAERSVDLVILRHLNVEVVTSPVAEDLFSAAVSTVRPRGFVLVLGHTPVLCSSAWFEMQGFEILKRIAHVPGELGLFEFYLLQRK